MAYDTDLTSDRACEAFSNYNNLDVVSSIEYLKRELEAAREMVFLLLSMRGGSVEYYKPGQHVHHEYTVTVTGDKTTATILEGAESLCHHLNDYIQHYHLCWTNTPHDVEDILSAIREWMPGSTPQFRRFDNFRDEDFSAWDALWEGRRHIIGYDPVEGEFFAAEGNTKANQCEYIWWSQDNFPLCH